MMRAHPRSRGEHWDVESHAGNVLGSSPLARGTRGVQGDFADCVGLIPARAGNTLEALTITREDWAHPRSRGEHGSDRESQGRGRGSSPLARGTRLFLRAGLPLNGLIPARAGNTFTITVTCRPWGGLIPARAGNTCWSFCSPVTGWAHPRSRGEHKLERPRQGRGAGSSPLARGTPSGRPGHRCRSGLIPARAGNTKGTPSKSPMMRAHPRSRGEHVPAVRFKLTGPGSSPLARGTQLLRRRPVCCLGLIPARAGNTPCVPCEWVVSGAHPRSRGEHWDAASTPAWSSGSSPLARGTRVLPTLPRGALGLIPARAGNTFMCRFLRWGGWAHPRSRGEHAARTRLTYDEAGSSPLARGTLHHPQDHRGRVGLIPARAGNTEGVPGPA